MNYQSLIFALSAFMLYEAVGAMAKYVSHKSCNNKPSGTYVAHPSNCNQYILCNGLRSLVGDCPTGTFFNELVLSCDTKSHFCKEKQSMKTLKETEVKMTTSKSEEEAKSASDIGLAQWVLTVPRRLWKPSVTSLNIKQSSYFSH